MSQSLVKNLIHLVYSTKRRQLWLADEVRASLFAYQAGIFENWDSPAMVINGMPDHVHALFSLSKNQVEACPIIAANWSLPVFGGPCESLTRRGLNSSSPGQSAAAQPRSAALGIHWNCDSSP